MVNRTINKAAGIYLYRFRLETGRQIQIGRLGSFHFPAGWYIYAGSALNGLEARLRRHYFGPASSRPHWHVDYLFQFAVTKSFAVVLNDPQGECRLNSAVAALAGAGAPAAGFGSSDCRCTSHLHHLLRELWPEFKGLLPWDPPKRIAAEGVPGKPRCREKYGLV